MLKDSIIQECLIVLKRNDVKDELKKLFSPIIDLILIQIFVIMIKLLHLQKLRNQDLSKQVQL